MKRFNIIITLSATLGLFSCELDKMPMDQVSDAVFWQKPADFELAANDFYFGLQEVSQYIDMNSDIAFGSDENKISANVRKGNLIIRQLSDLLAK